MEEEESLMQRSIQDFSECSREDEDACMPLWLPVEVATALVRESY